MWDASAVCVLMVNRATRPPGNTDGRMWSRSPRSVAGLLTTLGTPPAAATLINPSAKELVAKTIVSPSTHDAPRGGEPPMLQRVMGDPPVTAIFFSSEPLKKAIQRLSGEKTG